jgi:hypothetical protein
MSSVVVAPENLPVVPLPPRLVVMDIMAVRCRE